MPLPFILRQFNSTVRKHARRSIHIGPKIPLIDLINSIQYNFRPSPTAVEIAPGKILVSVPDDELSSELIIKTQNDHMDIIREIFNLYFFREVQAIQHTITFAGEPSPIFAASIEELLVATRLPEHEVSRDEVQPELTPQDIKDLAKGIKSSSPFFAGGLELQWSNGKDEHGETKLLGQVSSKIASTKDGTLKLQKGAKYHFSRFARFPEELQQKIAHSMIPSFVQHERAETFTVMEAKVYSPHLNYRLLMKIKEIMGEMLYNSVDSPSKTPLEKRIREILKEIHDTSDNSPSNKPLTNRR